MPTPIELDALAHALETGRSIDTDELRCTVVAMYRAYLICKDYPNPEDEDPDDSSEHPDETTVFKAFPSLPRA